MKLIRYEDPVDGVALDLHHRLTVISGLGADARRRLIEAVAALPEGADPGRRQMKEYVGAAGLDDLRRPVRPGELEMRAAKS